MGQHQIAVCNDEDQPQKMRSTIGLMIRNVGDWVHQLTWLGTTDVTQEQDINLICFAGGALNSPNSFESQANILYRLINVDQLDGLIMNTPGLGIFVTQAELADFTKQFSVIPTIEPSLFAVGQPLREMMVHLIQEHNYRRIAFIRGPKNHSGAEIRYQDYLKTLRDFDLPVDPELIVAPEQDWLGDTEIRHFLDQRNLPQDIDFEAIIGANDERALIMLKELQKSGIHVPGDVAVVGKDDQPQSRISNPPLTTIDTPIYEQGRILAKIFLAHLQGANIPTEVELAQKLIIRRSCGCLPTTVTQAAVRPAVLEDNAASKALGDILMRRQRKIVGEIVQYVEAPTRSLALTWSEALVTDLACDLNNTESHSASRLGTRFLLTFERILFQAAEVGGDLISWHNVISMLRRQILPHLSTPALIAIVEDLCSQARVLISEVERWQAANQRQLAKHQAATLREVGIALITTFNVGELLDILAQSLPRLDIPGCYLSLYENPEDPTGWARLRLAYNKPGRVQIASTGIRFPARQLMPAQMWPQDRCYSLLVQPLYFQENQLGFVLFEMGPRDGNIYETLCRHISSALKGALLVEQVESHAAALESEVKQRTADLRSTNTQLRQEIGERKHIETQLKTSLQEKEVLLREIHHRVKNNMQIISSLLDLQADLLQDEQTRNLFRESQQRIKSMAFIHEQLYQSNDLAHIDFADYVQRLTDYLQRSYSSKASRISIHLAIEPISLSVDAVIPCGLIINELVTNAMKHAFPPGSAGKVSIGLQCTDDKHLLLVVSDNGVGFPAEVDISYSQSLGLTLITTLVKQMKGTLELHRQNGTEFRIRFAIPTTRNDEKK